jgi:hypothetical protein
MTPEVSKAQLASMGLAGLQPISDAAGRRVRGNRAIFGGFDAVGIPLDSVGRARLVAFLNWSYHEGFPDLGAVIWRHLIERGEYAEPIPPGRPEF